MPAKVRTAPGPKLARTTHGPARAVMAALCIILHDYQIKTCNKIHKSNDIFFFVYYNT